MDMRRTLFTGGRVYTGGQLLDTEVLVRDGRIAAVGDQLDRAAADVVALHGNLLSAAGNAACSFLCW